jgi:hypothetical protein
LKPTTPKSNENLGEAEEKTTQIERKKSIENLKNLPLNVPVHSTTSRSACKKYSLQ